MNRKLFDGSFLKRRRSAIAPQEVRCSKCAVWDVRV